MDDTKKGGSSGENKIRRAKSVSDGKEKISKRKTAPREKTTLGDSDGNKSNDAKPQKDKAKKEDANGAKPTKRGSSTRNTSDKPQRAPRRSTSGTDLSKKAVNGRKPVLSEDEGEGGSKADETGELRAYRQPIAPIDDKMPKGETEGKKGKAKTADAEPSTTRSDAIANKKKRSSRRILSTTIESMGAEAHAEEPKAQENEKNSTDNASPAESTAPKDTVSIDDKMGTKSATSKHRKSTRHAEDSSQDKDKEKEKKPAKKPAKEHADAPPAPAQEESKSEPLPAPSSADVEVPVAEKVPTPVLENVDKVEIPETKPEQPAPVPSPTPSATTPAAPAETTQQPALPVVEPKSAELVKVTAKSEPAATATVEPKHAATPHSPPAAVVHSDVPTQDDSKPKLSAHAKLLAALAPKAQATHMQIPTEISPRSAAATAADGRSPEEDYLAEGKPRISNIFKQWKEKDAIEANSRAQSNPGLGTSPRTLESPKSGSTTPTSATSTAIAGSNVPTLVPNVATPAAATAGQAAIAAPPTVAPTLASRDSKEHLRPSDQRGRSGSNSRSSHHSPNRSNSSSRDRDRRLSTGSHSRESGDRGNNESPRVDERNVSHASVGPRRVGSQRHSRDITMQPSSSADRLERRDSHGSVSSEDASSSSVDVLADASPNKRRSDQLNIIRRTSSGRLSSSSSGGDVRLKEDLRRYREGYDYYKYKFKEMEEILKQEGLDKFKREFDHKRRQVRELEEQHREDTKKITELEADNKYLRERLSKYEPVSIPSTPTSGREVPQSNRHSAQLNPSISATNLVASLPDLKTLPAIENKRDSLTLPGTGTGNTNAATNVLKKKGTMADLTGRIPADLSSLKRTFRPAFAGKPDLDRRNRIVLELLETEQTYVTSLSILIENYLKPLREFSKVEPKVSEDDINKIFADGSIEGISMVNAALCQQIEDRLADWDKNECVGDIFDQWAPRFKTYCRYGSKYEECLAHVTDLYDKSSKFQKALDICEENVLKFNGLKLKDLMIMPVQRVPRYNMLLKDLLKNTPETHPDHLALTSACKKVEDQAAAVNEAIRQAEGQTKMAAIIERGGGFENLYQKDRSFVKSSTIQMIVDMSDRKKGSKSSKKDCELLVFNDILVAGSFVAKKADHREYSLPLPLLWISQQLDDEAKSLVEQEQLKVDASILVKSPEKTWLLTMKDTLERDTWLNLFAILLKIPVEELAVGDRVGKYEFSLPLKGIYDGEWLDGQIHGNGTYVRSDGVIFKGHWDSRIKAGYGTVTSNEQIETGWRNNRPDSDVEVHDEFGLWGPSVLTERDWSLLLTGAREVQAKKGETIIAQGKENHNMYRIKTGNCKVFKTGDSGRMELATMGPKTMFGDTSVMQSLKLATADVVADSDVVELYAIEVPILHEILKNNTGLAMRFWKGMATKLSQRLRNLHAPPAKKKKNSKKAIAAENATAGARQAGAGSDGDASADSSFCHKFDLPPQEVVIKELECVLKAMFKKYGTMYISQKYICFESNVFGMNSQEVIPLAKVVGIELKKKDLKVSLKSKKYTFVIENNPEEINSLLASLLQGIKAQASPSDRDEEEPGSSLSLKHSNTRNMSKDATAMSLTPQDWQLLMQGFKLVTYVKDEVVVQVGVAHSRIYQIAKGKCRIEISTPEGPKVVGTMETGALFGEMSLLEGGGASASVIGDDAAVDMYILEGYFINILFVRFPELAGRFFGYLASVIAERLNAREAAIAKELKKKKQAAASTAK